MRSNQWSSREERELIAHCREKRSSAEIAATMGRSRYGVMHKIRHLVRAGRITDRRGRGDHGALTETTKRLLSQRAAERLAAERGIPVERVGDYRFLTASKRLLAAEAVAVIKASI